MKNHKIILFLFVIFTVCLAFTACSQNNANSNESGRTPADNINIGEGSDPEATTESYYDILGERDFKDGTFTILDANDHPDFVINFPAEEEMNGDPINDALYIRDKLIEEKYGVNIKYIQMTMANTGCAALEKSVLAGDSAYDLVVSPVLGGALNRISTLNILYNMMDSPYLSLTSPWWSKLIYENMQFNNKLYYDGGDIFLPSYSQCPAMMMFNKKLLQDYGINDNLYDIVFEGKWTLDVLEGLIKDTNIDLNQDGKMTAEEDFYGLVYQYNAISMGFFFAGVGMKYSESTGDTINIELKSNAYIDKIQRLTDMLDNIKYTDQNNIINITFKNDKALFLAHCLNSPQVFLRDMESDYGILPMPKWDEKQESYVSFMNAWGSGFVAIPQNADIEKSAFLTEAMAYAGYETLRKPVYEITLKAKGARDEESEKIIDLIIETSYMDINGVYNFGGTYDIVRDSIMDKKPFVSSYEKKEAAMQKDIEKFITAMSRDD